MKAILTVGVSASGKSTFADEMVKQGWMKVERDLIRKLIFKFDQWNKYKFNKTNEDRVTDQADYLLERAANKKQNVVISDTNLNPKYRVSLIMKLKKLGYEVEIKDFPISYEEAVKRDLYRPMSVGQQVIYKQYQQWLEYVGEKKYQMSGIRPDAVIFDVDGTLASMHNRGPFEWSKVGQDKVRSHIVKLIDGFDANGDEIIFLSGRDGVCANETQKWLNQVVYECTAWCDFKVAYDVNLFMREEGDMRKDSIIKKELFWKHVAPYYDVHTVVDDRPQMIRAWYELGIDNVICVGNPYIEF